MLLAQTSYDKEYKAQPSIMCVYDENMNLVYGVQTADPTDTGAITWGGYTNLYGITTGSDGTNYCLYCIDYDAAVIFRVIDAGSDVYNFDSTSIYPYAPLTSAPEGTKGYGVDITTDGSAIYGLFANATDVWNGDYSNSAVVKLPMTLGTTVSARNDGFAYNAFSLQLYTGGTEHELLVTSIGGKQNYGSTNGDASKIQEIITDFSSTTTVDTLLIGGSTALRGDFRALAFKADGSDAFIFTGRYDTAGTTFSGALYHTTMTALEAQDGALITDDGVSDANIVLSSISGYLWALLYSQADSATWMARGNDLAVYKYTSGSPSSINLKASIAMSDLATGSTPGDYSLNSVTIFGTTTALRGYQAPAAASHGQAAVLERMRLLKLKK